MHCEQLEDRRLLVLITVTTDQDVVDFNDGVTSLREAIFAANVVPGPDEIQFDFGHDGPATILITQGELAITDSLTITGSGAELLAIDASGNDPTPGENNGDGSRIFNIDDGEDSSTIDVKLHGMSLTGGDVSESGGAIFSRENLTLANITIRDNAAGDEGGGVYSTDADLTITNGTIRDNETLGFKFFSDGGGVFSDGGKIFISDSIFLENTAVGRAGGQRVVNNVATIERTSFERNVTTRDWGGAIHSSNATLSVYESTFTGNEAISPLRAGGGRGGAILIDAGSVLSVENSTFSGNVARHGGAIAGSDSTQATLSISHSTIVSNLAALTGGGINLLGITSSALEYTIVADNQHRSELGPPVDNDIGGHVNAQWSLIEVIQGTITGGNNIVGQDPLLGPLADNGGPTRTHALLPGSPAINAGDPNLAQGQASPNSTSGVLPSHGSQVAASTSVPTNFNPPRVSSTAISMAMAMSMAVTSSPGSGAMVKQAT